MVPSLCWCQGLCKTSQFSLLNLMRFLSVNFSSTSVSFWIAAWPSVVTGFPSLRKRKNSVSVTMSLHVADISLTCTYKCVVGHLCSHGASQLLTDLVQRSFQTGAFEIQFCRTSPAQKSLRTLVGILHTVCLKARININKYEQNQWPTYRLSVCLQDYAWVEMAG